jgi:hypothetical protein
MLGPQVKCILGIHGDSEKAGFTTWSGTAGLGHLAAATLRKPEVRGEESGQLPVLIRAGAGPFESPNKEQSH